MKKIYGCGVADQRLMWDDLRKSINNLFERVCESNIRNVAEELISLNLELGRGLFCRAILRSLSSSSVPPPVLGALIAIVNSKFPDVGYLLLKRILFQARIAYESNDEIRLRSFAMLLAHLVNNRVAHEITGVEFLIVLLQERIPTNGIIEIAVCFVTECGSALCYKFPRKLDSVFERFGEILDDCKCRAMIEGLFGLRKSGFLGYPELWPELENIVTETEEDQVTHEISNYHDLDPEMSLDFFHPYSDLIFSDDHHASFFK